MIDKIFITYFSCKAVILTSSAALLHVDMKSPPLQQPAGLQMQDFAYFRGKGSALFGLCSTLGGVPSPEVEKVDAAQGKPEAVSDWE